MTHPSMSPETGRTRECVERERDEAVDLLYAIDFGNARGDRWDVLEQLQVFDAELASLPAPNPSDDTFDTAPLRRPVRALNDKEAAAMNEIGMPEAKAADVRERVACFIVKHWLLAKGATETNAADIADIDELPYVAPDDYLACLNVADALIASGLIAQPGAVHAAIGYFLNALAYHGTFPDDEEDASSLRKSMTWNMLMARSLLSDELQAECSAASKRHASEQPEFKAQIDELRARIGEKDRPTSPQAKPSDDAPRRDGATDAERDQWRNLADAATPGPWFAYPFDPNKPERDWFVGNGRAGGHIANAMTYGEDDGSTTVLDDFIRGRNNADFAAAARTAVPVLLDALASAEQALAERTRERDTARFAQAEEYRRVESWRNSCELAQSLAATNAERIAELHDGLTVAHGALLCLFTTANETDAAYIKELTDNLAPVLDPALRAALASSQGGSDGRHTRRSSRPA